MPWHSVRAPGLYKIKWSSFDKKEILMLTAVLAIAVHCMKLFYSTRGINTFIPIFIYFHSYMFMHLYACSELLVTMFFDFQLYLGMHITSTSLSFLVMRRMAFLVLQIHLSTQQSLNHPLPKQLSTSLERLAILEQCT